MFKKQTQNEWPFDFEADDQVAMSFDCWLALSTMGLCDSAVTRLTPELREHYEAAYADALLKGKSKEEAARYAVETLGSPFKANKRYKKTYVTVEALKNYEKWRIYQKKKHWFQNPYCNFLSLIVININGYFILGWVASVFLLIAAFCILYAKELMKRFPDQSLAERMWKNGITDILWIFVLGYSFMAFYFWQVVIREIHWEIHWGIFAFIALLGSFIVFCQIYSYRYYKRIEDEMTKP